jgi:hypothetical protein
VPLIGHGAVQIVARFVAAYERPVQLRSSNPSVACRIGFPSETCVDTTIETLPPGGVSSFAATVSRVRRFRHDLDDGVLQLFGIIGSIGDGWSRWVSRGARR